MSALGNAEDTSAAANGAVVLSPALSGEGAGSYNDSELRGRFTGHSDRAPPPIPYVNEHRPGFGSTSSRLPEEKKAAAPGPGAYYPERVVSGCQVKDPRHAHAGYASKTPVASSYIPKPTSAVGPGQYYSPSKPARPVSRFGDSGFASVSNRAASYIPKSDTPGPLSYHSERATTAFKPAREKAFSSQSPLRPANKSDGPGPGAYNLGTSIDALKSRKSFGQSAAFASSPRVRAPDASGSKLNDSNYHTPNRRPASAPKGRPSSAYATPGPGQYELDRVNGIASLSAKKAARKIIDASPRFEHTKKLSDAPDASYDTTRSVAPLGKGGATFGTPPVGSGRRCTRYRNVQPRYLMASKSQLSMDAAHNHSSAK